MTRNQVREEQWIYYYLVNGFASPADSMSPDMVKTFRQERLKHMVLSTVFEDYNGSCRRGMAVASPYV